MLNRKERRAIEQGKGFSPSRYYYLEASQDTTDNTGIRGEQMYAMRDDWNASPDHYTYDRQDIWFDTH